MAYDLDCADFEADLSALLLLILSSVLLIKSLAESLMGE